MRPAIYEKIMQITLSETERKVVEAIAEARYKSNRALKVKDKQVGKQDKAFIDLNGLGGEWAFCKIVNVYPDFEIGVRSIHDAVALGGSWDIKTTDIEHGQLLVRPSKHREQKKCDYYALVVGSMPDYRLAGWASASEIFDPARLTDLGHGQTYAIPQEELHKFKKTES